MRRRTPCRILLLSSLVALLGVGTAVGDPQRSYKNGLNALADSRFPDAERYFRSAIAERAEERSGGGLRRTYLPHYYLGVALMKQNRCKEALASWQESERQGQVARTNEESAELPRNRQVCLDRVKTLDAARTAAEQAVAEARKAAQTLARVRETRELLEIWKQGNPSFSSREDGARGKLDAAARQLGSAAGEDPAAYRQAKALANEAANELDLIRSEAQEQLSQIRDRTSSALDRLEAAIARARSELEKVGYLKPYPPVLGSHAEKVEQALGEAESRKAKADPATMARLREALASSAESLKQAAIPPPRTLRTAVELFLAGSYQDVIATLEGETFRDRRAAGQACLLRAASRFELYELGGEEAYETAVALHADVQGCRELKEAADISSRYFSPRFVGYYENPPEPPEPPAGFEGALDEAAEDSPANPDETPAQPETPAQAGS